MENKTKIKKSNKITKKTTKRKKKKTNWILFTANLFITLILIGGIVALSFIIYCISTMPTIDIEDFESKQSSQIFDENGELIADIGDTIRTNITYDQLPTSLVDAFLSIEDSRYFQHNGFDIPRFSKSMINNVLSMSLKEGGSTFTMQLVDNVYFMETADQVSTFDSIVRKVQEIFLAMNVEKVLNKERILELYLNKINFGGFGNSRGVWQAAQFYFNKDIGELTIAESALLAGVINAPTTYNPFNYLDYATERRDEVLYLMNYHGYISDLDYELALAIKVEDLLVDPYDRDTDSNSVAIPYQAYIDVVIDETIELTGYDPTLVPMKIYTHMKKDVQETMDMIAAGDTDAFEYPDELIELAMMSMNTKTGAVNGVLGGRHYSDGGSLLLNYAIDQYNQPGSTMKPLLSYALAFETFNWSTSHVLVDAPFVYRGTDFVVKNASGGYRGDVDLKYAIGESLNTPALKTLQDIVDETSVSYVVEHLNLLGLNQVTVDNFDLGYGIGGSTLEVSVKELLGAFTTMLNGGYYNQPHTIERIEFIDNYEVIEPVYKGHQVISEESAFLVTELMKEAVYGPYLNHLQILKDSYPVYGKTGTTDWGNSGVEYGIPVGEAKDVWMTAGTSEYSVVTWHGYPVADSEVDTWISWPKNLLNIRGIATNMVLDVLHDELEEVAPITKPSNVVKIDHIRGLYPYTSPIENMDPKFLTSGYIKASNAKLSDPLKLEVEQLEDITVTVDALGKMKVSMPPYKDQDKLKVAEDKKEITLEAPDVYVEAFGTRAFDWSWVYGPIRYQVEVKINGNVTNTFKSDKETIEQTLTFLPGDKLEICAVYAFENKPEIRSNQVCKGFDVEDKDMEISFLSVNSTKTEIEAFAKSNNLRINYVDVKVDNLTDINNIFINIPDSSGNPVKTKINSTQITKKQSEWIKELITVEIYSECNENSSLVDGSCQCDAGYELSDDNSCVLKPEISPSPSTSPSIVPTT